MAFDLRFLQPVGGNARGGPMVDSEKVQGNAGSAWNYAHPTDLLAVIVTAGYFNKVRDLVNKEDSIKIFDSTNILRQAWFSASPKSPATGNVTISALKINAA